eukprot:CAMPEP_0195535534 /NCGR_PEP_ID=MMETSP0794_2-20130614/44438_1 /TAXON_ID=515487 /ORGANISM="Stephanopyxis turris, Strain CCMP 815" /LENGTH=42 /DNA_ID= /DNA_START= /DNA_END= /DNA_ORIENTATION=
MGFVSNEDRTTSGSEPNMVLLLAAAVRLSGIINGSTPTYPGS